MVRAEHVAGIVVGSDCMGKVRGKGYMGDEAHWPVRRGRVTASAVAGVCHRLSFLPPDTVRHRVQPRCV